MDVHFRIGDRGYIVRLSGKNIAFVENFPCTIYWIEDDESIVVKDDDGNVYKLREQEYFIAQHDKLTGTQIIVTKKEAV